MRAVWFAGWLAVGASAFAGERCGRSAPTCEVKTPEQITAHLYQTSQEVPNSVAAPISIAEKSSCPAGFASSAGARPGLRWVWLGAVGLFGMWGIRSLSGSGKGNRGPPGPDSDDLYKDIYKEDRNPPLIR